MKTTNRMIRSERIHGASREPVILRSPAQGPLFLKPTFAISARGGGLTVNVSARPPKDAGPRA